MEMILANGNKVKVRLGEIREFISAMPSPIPNPDWHYSELLTEEEVMRFLKGESSREELKKVARYILIYTENLGFTAICLTRPMESPSGPKSSTCRLLKS